MLGKTMKNFNLLFLVSPYWFMAFACFFSGCIGACCSCLELLGRVSHKRTICSMMEPNWTASWLDFPGRRWSIDDHRYTEYIWIYGQKHRDTWRNQFGTRSKYMVRLSHLYVHWRVFQWILHDKYAGYSRFRDVWSDWCGKPNAINGL